MRPDSHCRRLHTLTLAAILCALWQQMSEPVAAQPSDDTADPWYRIEILVFRQPGETGLTAEKWDPEPVLSYPERHRHLVDRALADARLQAYPGSRSEVDARGQQHLKLPEPRRREASALLSPTESPSLGEDISAIPAPPDTGGRESTVPAPGPDDQPALPAPIPLEPARNDAQLDTDNPDIPLPPPPAFTLLPERAKEFNRDAARMRSAGYDILLHSSWLQPVVAQDKARAIILDRSGDPDVTAWPSLQGSISLHLSRYLHLRTRLWLNTHGDYLHPEWRMPEPPLSPSSVEFTIPTLDERQWLAETSQPPGIEVTRPDASVQPPLQSEAMENRVGSRYPWGHSIPLQQSRRMRSGELHYLDHPVLGVLVKITPMEEPDLRRIYLETRDPAWEDRHNVAYRPEDAPSEK